LISSRHTKTIFRISGQDGSVIWRLGGKQSSFTQLGYEFDFQHHARIRVENGTSLVISLYDNGSDDAPAAPGQSKPGYQPYSTGLVVALDTSTMESRLIDQYVPPVHWLSTSQGDLQFLDNGNKFMGMGSWSIAMEFTDNSTGKGEVAWLGHMAWDGGASHSSYRNFKTPWFGQPAAAPKLFTYANNCSTDVVMYASWNGATEIDHWKFKTSNHSYGHFHTVGTVPKGGFETMASFPGSLFNMYTYAEAVDAYGNGLARTNVEKTFVPASIVQGCSTNSCGYIDYETTPQANCTVVL
jgi:hypothetical protein